MILSVCCRKQIKTSRLPSFFRFHVYNLPGHYWLTFLAVMISAPDGLIKVINCNSVLHRPKKKTVHLLVSEIVLCSTMPCIPYLARSIVTRSLR